MPPSLPEVFPIGYQSTSVELKEFGKLLHSPEAQAIVTELGFVPVNP